jgi:hypothetical protein
MSLHRLRAARRPAFAVLFVVAAVSAGTVAGVQAAGQSSACPDQTVDIGTYCLSSSLQTANGQSTADYFTATRVCASQGGYLPSAEELIGAANQVRLAGRLDDNSGYATIDTNPADGLTDWREMTSTLVTTRSGSDAAGTLGVSVGATGNPAKGEPSPSPAPADTAPASLQYVTVIANGGQGGFAGSEPVSTPERFRCAFNAQSPAYVPPPPPVTVAHPGLVAPSAVALGTLGRPGINVTVSCAAPCSYRVALTMSAADARRFGVSGRASGPATLALSPRRVGHLSAGSEVQLSLRPSRSLVSNLRYWLNRLKRSSVAAGVVLTFQQSGDRRARTITRRMSIRR